MWNPIDYGNITKIRFPSSIIWTPDLIMMSSADSDSFRVTTDINLEVNYKGLVTYFPTNLFKSNCLIKVGLFPFDTQNCNLTFGRYFLLFALTKSITF